MKQLHDLMRDILANGNKRDTRSGEVTSVFHREVKFDMREGLPFPMTKRLAFKSMMGELLWFLSGECNIPDLRMRSNLPPRAWTIWTPDAKRWGSEDLGKLYGYQWRNYGGEVDQIQDLVDKMRDDQASRYLIVNAYNPQDISEKTMALPPCHMGFQVYIEGEEFDLKWSQRSVDVFLGLPYNIASYGMLMKILQRLTGLTPRHLIGTLGDTHIYTNHIPQVNEQLSRDIYQCCATVDLPEDLHSLRDILLYTARDFKMDNYYPHPPIKADLCVGGTSS